MEDYPAGGLHRVHHREGHFTERFGEDVDFLAAALFANFEDAVLEFVRSSTATDAADHSVLALEHTALFRLPLAPDARLSGESIGDERQAPVVGAGKSADISEG